MDKSNANRHRRIALGTNLSRDFARPGYEPVAGSDALSQLKSIDEYIFRVEVLAYDEGKPEESEALCRGALLQYPNNVPLICILAELIGPMHAEYLLRQAISDCPPSPHLHADLAKALTRLGRVVEAESVLRHAVTEFRQESALLFKALGDVLAIQTRHEEGESAYRHAVSREPSRPLFRQALARYLNKLGKKADSEVADDDYEGWLRNALEQDGNTASISNRSNSINLARLLRVRKKYNEAEEAYRAVLRHYPEHVASKRGLLYVYRDQAKALMNEERFAEAEKRCNDAINLDPSSAIGRSLLGRCFMLQSRYAEAEEQYRMQIAAGPDSSFGYVLLSRALEAQGKRVEAKEALRTGYKIAPWID